MREKTLRNRRHTEFANEMGLLCIWSPFTIGDVVLVINIETKSLCALDTLC